MEKSLSRRVVAIVGMHRSGTSCLAGTLQEAGLHLGTVITEAPHNAKGNRENRRIMDLQDAILAHSGGSWDEPPPEVTWTDAHRDERDDIIATYGDAELWGFKDPRTLVTLGFWREAVPDLSFVGTFRHPFLVAESLCRRNGGTVEKWLGLWREYNERMLVLTESSPFPVVRFDTDPGAYRRSLERIVDTLGLSVTAELGFFEPLLRHHVEAPDTPLPPDVQALYETLCALAI